MTTFNMPTHPDPSRRAVAPERGRPCRPGAVMILIGIAILLLGATSCVQAQLILTLPVDPLPVDAQQGGTASFTATLTNDFGYDLYLNSDLYVLFNPATLDDSPFQNYFAMPANGVQPTLAANGGSVTLDLFLVSLPGDTPPGIYSGTITLEGGPTPLDTDNLATQQFAVAAVPEPSSAALVCCCLLSGIALLRSRRRACASV